MIFPDRIGVGERVRRQRQHWLGIAGSVGAGPREHFDKLRIGRVGADGPIDDEGAVAARRGNAGTECILDESAEVSESLPP